MTLAVLIIGIHPGDRRHLARHLPCLPAAAARAFHLGHDSGHIPSLDLPAIRFGSPLLLHLGEPPSPVPEPFAGLLLWQTGQAGRTTSTWLFPGRNPGQPLAYATMFNQLRELGFPNAHRTDFCTPRTRRPSPALGFHDTTTQRQHVNAGATWSRYAPLATRDRAAHSQPIVAPPPRRHRASGAGQIRRAGTGASVQRRAPSGSTRQARLPATTLTASCSAVPT
jgi:hypothetical protein